MLLAIIMGIATATIVTTATLTGHITSAMPVLVTLPVLDLPLIRFTPVLASTIHDSCRVSTIAATL